MSRSPAAIVRPTSPFWANALDGTAAGGVVTVERRTANGLSGWISLGLGRTALTDATTSTRLQGLVRAGLLTRRPYRRPGERRRDEYVLTPAGAELMPALFALLQWANEHDPPPYPPALHHDGCGEPVTVTARCSAGHVVGADEIAVTAPGPFGLDEPLPPDA